MLRRRGALGYPQVRLNRENFPRLVGAGATAGALSGFFGIGGGFLIVPGLMFASDMPILNAIGSSLVVGRRLRGDNGGATTLLQTSWTGSLPGRSCSAARLAD